MYSLRESILAQLEMGGFEVVFDAPIGRPPAAVEVPKPAPPPPKQDFNIAVPQKQADSGDALWERAESLEALNAALVQNRLYAGKGFKKGEGRAPNPKLFLVYENPSQYPPEAQEMMVNLVTKVLKVAELDCYITYWLKADLGRALMPREKIFATNALKKEAVLVRP
jgi:hypothetical protein